MSINTRTMYDQFVSAEGVSDSGRMETAYLRALNRSLRELRDDCWVEDAEPVEELGEIADLDDKFEPILEDGIKYYIQRSGEWTKDPDKQARAYWEQSIGKARKFYFQDNDSDVWPGAHG